MIKSLLALLFALILCIHSHGQGTEPPTIASISLTSSVDVTSGNQTVTATVQVTDNDLGFDFGNLFLYRPDGNFVSSHGMGSTQRISGDEFDGIYEVAMTVPQYASPGIWEVHGFVENAQGDTRDYGGGNEPFPVPADATFTVINSGSVDTAPPAVASVSVTPSPIDTGSISQNITITLSITDDLAGFRSASLSFKDPNSDPKFGISGFTFFTSVTSGDALNGTYTINSTIPQGSLDGTWTFDLFLSDQVGNRTTVSAPAGATFDVSNTAISALGDLSDASDATQFTWNTSGGQDWFSQSAETNDGIDAAQSGAIGDDEVSDMEVTLTGPGTLDFYWKVDSEEFNDILSVEVLSGGDYEEISGNVDWSATSVTIPSGSQTVRFRYEKNSDTSEGADAGWVDNVCFLADSDQEAPVIQRIILSPNPVDLTAGFTEVTVTIEVSDDFNGFFEGYVYLTEDGSGNEYNSASFDSNDLVSGDSKFGIYEVTMEFYAEDFDEIEGSFLEGTYRITAEVSDQVTGNTRYYGNEDDPFPIPSTEFFTVGGSPDGPAPFLTSIDSITPGTVDVTAGDQSVTIEFGINSGSSGFGFGFGNIFLYKPDGSFVRSIFFDGSDRISGDDESGTYSVTIPIYQYSQPGIWKANFLLSDFDDNSREYPMDTEFPDPGDEEFTVANTGSIDSTAPVLAGFTLSTTTVDTSASPQSISVNFSLTDDLSGIESVSLYAYDPNDDFAGDLFTSFPTSGLLNDSYTGSFDLPAASLEGTWNSVLSVRDRAGNSFFYVSGSLGFGDPFPGPVSGQFTVGPVPGTTFTSFANTFGLTGIDALPGANPDGDFFNNVMEFLLGLDPTVENTPDPNLYEVVRLGAEIQINFTIDPNLTVTPNGNVLELSNGGGPPVTIVGQSGINLQNDWVDQLPTLVSGSKYRVTLPITSAPRGMLRLRFTTP